MINTFTSNVFQALQFLDTVKETPASEQLEEAYISLVFIMLIVSMLAPIVVTVATLVLSIAFSVVSFLISAVLSVVFYFIEAIPVFSAAKKNGNKKAFLAWMPLFSDYFRTYVICGTPADKPFTLFNKTVFKDRKSVYWMYLAISLFGTVVVSVITAILQGVVNIIPLLGQLVALVLILLPFVPVLVCAVVEYVFLRDVLDAYKGDKKSNVVLAIIATVVDSLVPIRIARTFCLYTIIGRKPISKQTHSENGEEPVA